MKRVKSLWDQEPVAFLSVIQAAVALFTAFGLELSGEQVGAIMAFSAALIGFITRQKVAPIDTTPRVPTSRLPLILLLAGALSAPACASSGRILVEADRGIHATLTTLDDVINRLCDAQLSPAAGAVVVPVPGVPAACRAFNASLADAYAAYQRFNSSAQDGSIAGVPAMVTALADIRAAALRLKPEGSALLDDLLRWHDSLQQLLPAKEE